MSSLFVIPISDSGSSRDMFDELIWGDDVLVFSAIERRDVCRTTDLVVLGKGKLQSCAGGGHHDEVDGEAEGDDDGFNISSEMGKDLKQKLKVICDKKFTVTTA